MHTQCAKTMTAKEIKIFCFGFFVIQGRLIDRTPFLAAARPSGLPLQQHPVTEPEEDHQEEEPANPRQLDHHPGAAGSRLQVSGREENIQPSSLRDHGVTGGQRGGIKKEYTDDTNWEI